MMKAGDIFEGILFMFVLCWVYCVPFVKFLYYAVAPLLLFFAFYVMKRGICREILWLRYSALVLAWAAVSKIFLMDVSSLARDMACQMADRLCSATGVKIFQMAGGCLFALSAVVLLMLGARFGKKYRPPRLKIPANDKPLRFWANLSMFLVLILCCWLSLPLLSYLAVGDTPQLFFKLRWQFFAMLNFLSLAIGFWRIEDYHHYYNDGAGERYVRQKDAGKVWVPSDTLWTVLPIYLLAVAAGVMSDDLFRSL